MASTSHVEAAKDVLASSKGRRVALAEVAPGSVRLVVLALLLDLCVLLDKVLVFTLIVLRLLYGFFLGRDQVALLLLPLGPRGLV